LHDYAINDIIRSAYQSNEDSRRRLNSIWLLTMKKNEVTKHQFLNELNGKHNKHKNSSIEYLEKIIPDSNASPEITTSYTFDECMEELHRQILDLENRFEYKGIKPLKDYTDIYHTSGTTVNKKQLLHLVVAPQHYKKTNYIYSKNLLDNKTEFNKNVSPIYFSSLSDAITAQLLYAGLKRNHSNTRVHQIMSDFPQVKMPFVRDVFIEMLKMKELKGDTDFEEKGIRTLSKFLGSVSGDGKRQINIFLDTNMDTETSSFFQNQDYREMAESDDIDSVFKILLYTLVILAGGKNYIKVVDTKDEADIILSLKASSNSIKIPIFRFIPVAVSNTNIYKMISTPEKDTRNIMFLTVGGPEHNKLLELFIALHRWYGGETVFNHSNYFDRKFSMDIQSALLLFNEAYVGGIAIKGTQNEGSLKETEEKNRAGKGAFVVTFSIPTDLPWIEKLDHAVKEIKIVAIIGMSAVGTTLGTTYVAFKEEFNVGKDEITFIDIPDNIENLGVKNVDKKQKKFIIDYLKYLQNKKNDLKVPLPGEVYIETLLNPVEKEFYTAMQIAGIEFDELKGYESHAKLWSLIAERYLIRRY